MKYIMVNCNVFDGNKEAKIRENVSILIEEDKIVKIFEGNITSEYSQYTTIDMKGRYVLPGLINLHAHLFGTGKPSKALGGGNAQKKLVRFIKTKAGGILLNKMMKANMLAELKSGVTTVRGVGDFCYSDVKLRDQINSGKVTGPRLLVSGPIITVPGGHGDGTMAITAKEPEELRKLVRENAAHKVDLIKICVTGGVMDAKVKGEPGELRMNLEQTKAVCEEARKAGYIVASHSESKEGVRIALKGGVTTIEHGSSLDEEMIALFHQNKGALICTFTPALALANIPPELTKLDPICVYNSKVVFDGMVAGAKDALANDIPVGLGTDAGCPYAMQYNFWREICFFAREVGVSNAFALYTATLQHAKILGIDSYTGSIEVGKCADLIAVDSNPLDDLNALRNVSLVMARGRLVKNLRIKKNTVIDKELDRI